MRRPLAAASIFGLICLACLGARAHDLDEEKKVPDRGSLPDRQFKDWSEAEQYIRDTAHCDDEAAIVNRVFHGRYGLDKSVKDPPTPQQVALLRDYFTDEDRTQDNLKDHARREDAPKIVAIFNDETLRSRHELKNEINAVLARNGTSVEKIRAEGGESVSPFQNLKTDLQQLSQSPLKDAVMHGDSIAMAIMSKADAEKEAKAYANNGTSAGALFGAKDAMAQGDAAGAMAMLDSAVAKDPSNGEALSLRAAANMMNGDKAAAANDARAALAINSGDQRALQVVGLTKGRSGTSSTAALDGAGALGADRSGSSGSSPSGGAAPWLGKVGTSANDAAQIRDAQQALNMGNDQAAIDAASKIIAANPGNAQAYNLRSVAYNRQGQFALALKDAEAGLRADPKNVALLLAKANALNKLRRYAEAEAAARQALELDPNNAGAYNALAEALAGQHRNQEAIAALKSAAALDPRYADKAKQALQLPSESDLSFLFPNDDAAAVHAAPKSSAADRARRFKFVATASIVGGSLLALGLLQFLMPNIKEALSKITRRGPRVSEDALPEAEPRNIAVLTERQQAGLLKNQYQVGREIGSGGMGLVYEGQDVVLKRRVAIKKMREEIRAEPRERERFISEARMVAGLHHPGIVDIFAIAEEGDGVYLIFEYIAGKTLHEVAHAGRGLSLGQATPLFKAAAEAIDFAHTRNIIHRDLKPSNIMVTGEGKVKVMDFGIARVAKDALSRYSMTNTVVGTPPYMAPEQEQGIVRREADVYALAVCLYETLSGALPFSSAGQGMLLNKINRVFTPITKVVPGLPPGVDAVFTRAFDPDPEKRFHSGKELVAALETLALPQRG